MLFRQSRCIIADNSGAKSALIIGIRGVKKIASIGSVVTVAIKDVRPHAKVKLGDVHRAVVVRCRKEIGRKDGRYVSILIQRYIRFDDNAIVLVSADLTPIASRVLGPIGLELRNEKFMKLVSLAPKLL